MRDNIPYEYSDYVLEKYFHDTGTSQGWLPENNKSVGVAVSGGGDSIALLWLCSKFYHGRIFALHVNHGIRGQESDSDMNFTKDFADSLNVEFIAKSSSVPCERVKGESLESAARRIRQRDVCSMARELNLDSIFLGHNRDDLAETVLFNILRGTGIRGSVGITESSELDGVKFYRPLLGLRRKFLRDILSVRGLTWREDSSNNDDSYTRNYLRLQLLPLIESKINSSAIEHLANFGVDMRRVRELEDSKSQELFDSCIDDKFSGLVFNRKKLRELNEDDITLIIREAGRRLKLKTLSRSRCLELAKLIIRPQSFIFQWVQGVSIISRQGKIFFDDKRGEINNNDSESLE
ncbi:MAG: tRNA lysidine(34) synthetase TilS [Synergistaceae bacterium]|nr:tRNA lysidine(34) synthetase TilS [Synergistaceae bacterium]